MMSDINFHERILSENSHMTDRNSMILPSKRYNGISRYHGDVDYSSGSLASSLGNGMSQGTERIAIDQGVIYNESGTVFGTSSCHLDPNYSRVHSHSTEHFYSQVPPNILLRAKDVEPNLQSDERIERVVDETHEILRGESSPNVIHQDYSACDGTMSPSIPGGFFKYSNSKDSPTPLEFELDTCKRDITTDWSQSPTFPSLSPSVTLWSSPTDHAPRISSQLTQYISTGDDKSYSTDMDDVKEETESMSDSKIQEPSSPLLEVIYNKLKTAGRGMYASRALDELCRRMDSVSCSGNSDGYQLSDTSMEPQYPISDPIQRTEPPKVGDLRATDVTFQIKPARKGSDFYVSNTPRDLYSQPYKYDIKITYPSVEGKDLEPSLQLYVEKRKQLVGRNHKNERSLIMERVTKKELKGRIIYNYRVVFNVCSFHVSKSLISLHVYFVSTDVDQLDKVDYSTMEPLWKSCPFELFARKVNPTDWPNEKEVLERVRQYERSKSRQPVGNILPINTTADPALLSQVVNNATQKNPTPNGRENGYELKSEKASDTEEKARKPKRKRNLQVDTQFTKRHRSLPSGDNQDSTKV